MVRKALAASILAALLALPGVKAFAAPSGAPSSSTFPVQCGGGSFWVTINHGQSGNQGQGRANAYSPAFIVSGGSGLAILQSISFVITDPNNQVVFSGSQTKGNSQAAGMSQDTCTFTQYQNGFTFNGTVTVAINPNANTAH